MRRYTARYTYHGCLFAGKAGACWGGRGGGTRCVPAERRERGRVASSAQPLQGGRGAEGRCTEPAASAGAASIASPRLVGLPEDNIAEQVCLSVALVSLPLSDVVPTGCFSWYCGGGAAPGRLDARGEWGGAGCRSRSRENGHTPG